MNLVTFNPEKELDSFFDTDSYFGFPRIQAEQSSVLPKVNIVEKEEAFYLYAETPGMTQNDVLVEFQDGILTLKGNQEQNSQSDISNYRIREFSQKSFARSFRLSDQVDSEKVVARMDQGILKVTLPKKEQAKPKKIDIKVAP
jgi:HSP20 family protein